MAPVTEPDFDPIGIFKVLDRARVTYVVIGALARVLQGTDELTDGVDVVPVMREENLRRLDLALGQLNARRRDGQKSLALAGVDVLELGERHQDPAAAADDAKLVDDVVVEVVAADAESIRRLVRAERESSGRRSTPLIAFAAALLLRRRWLRVGHLEFQLLRRGTRHATSVADLIHERFLGL